MTRSAWILATLLCLPLITLADHPESPPTLNWETCTQLVLKKNPDILAEKAKVDAARSQISIAEAGYWPQVNLTGSIKKSNNDSLSSSLGISLTQTLFPDAISQPDSQEAKANLEAEIANQKIILATLRSQLLQNISAIQYNEKNIALTHKIVERRIQNADLVNARFKAGRENLGAYLRAKAQAEQGKLDEVQAKRELETSQDDLAATLGITPNITMNANAPTLSLPEKMELEAWIKTSPQIENLKALIKAAQWRIVASENQLWPSLSASIGSTYEFANGGTSTTTTGLTGTLPLFTFGRLENSVYYAKLTVEILKWNLESLQRQTLILLKKSYFTAQNSIESDRVQTEFVKAAELRSEIAQAQYTTGLISYDNWDIIENDLISQQKTGLTRKRDIQTNIATFEKYLGKGLGHE